MDPFIACVIIGVASVVLMPWLMKRSSVRRKYEQMTDKDLVRAKVNAERMWKYCLAISFLGPIPLAFVATMLKDSGALKYLLCLMILAVLGGIANFGIWWQIVTITKSELEIRKVKKHPIFTPNSAAS